VRSDHNLAFVRVAEPGSDLLDIVRARLRDLCLHRVDCVYVDLPLSHPATASVRLGELGFFFGAVIPEASDGDVLRLQYLNNVEPGEATTASEFGAELLELIVGQREVVGG
jgi:hypothetical protein